MNKIITNCKGCGRQIKDEIDLWDKEKNLCDKCSIKQNSNTQTENKLNLSYIN